MNIYVSQTLTTDFPSLETARSRLLLRISALMTEVAGHLKTVPMKFARAQKAEEELNMGTGTAGKSSSQYFVVLHFLGH